MSEQTIAPRGVPDAIPKVETITERHIHSAYATNRRKSRRAQKRLNRAEQRIEIYGSMNRSALKALGAEIKTVYN